IAYSSQPSHTHLASYPCYFLLYMSIINYLSFFFFFTDTAPTEIYTLSLHDALPIFLMRFVRSFFTCSSTSFMPASTACAESGGRDRKSTRLNSSHVKISYAVFCLKKKKKKENIRTLIENTRSRNIKMEVYRQHR